LLTDSPGTRECPDLPGEPTLNACNEAAIDALRGHRAIDPDGVRYFGVGFGGYWAVKMALLR
jgi:hypothetical protein